MNHQFQGRFGSRIRRFARLECHEAKNFRIAKQFAAANASAQTIAQFDLRKDVCLAQRGICAKINMCAHTRTPPHRINCKHKLPAIEHWTLANGDDVGSVGGKREDAPVVRKFENGTQNVGAHLRLLYQWPGIMPNFPFYVTVAVAARPPSICFRCFSAATYDI